MFSKIWASADARAPLQSALAGASLGLAVGALFLVGGMARHIAEGREAERMSLAATQGYEGLGVQPGRGLALGLFRFGPGSDAETMRERFAEGRGAARARRAADLECMTQAVYFEARGESARGQAAVAQVVMNRVRHPHYPKSVCGVVFQGAGHSGCQFSFTCDGSMRHRRDLEAWAEARRVAGRALAGAVVAGVGGATHYHATSVYPFWAPHMLRVSQVGAHVFYRLTPYSGRRGSARVMLTSAPGQAQRPLKVSPSFSEAAIEASLGDLAPAADAPMPAAPKEDAVTLISQPAISAGVS